jgi:hypothetical protein
VCIKLQAFVYIAYDQICTSICAASLTVVQSSVEVSYLLGPYTVVTGRYFETYQRIVVISFQDSGMQISKRRRHVRICLRDMSRKEVHLSTQPSKCANTQKFPEKQNYNVSMRIYNIDTRSDRPVFISDLTLTKLSIVDGQAGLKMIKTSIYLHPKQKCYLAIKQHKINASHLILIISLNFI